MNSFSFTTDGWLHLLRALVPMFAFGISGIFLMLLGFKAFDWIIPKIDLEEELASKHNMAVAIVIGAVMLGISAICVSAML